ncbi:hypothetical protein SPMU_23780 [Sphingomonas mucosissima]|uniref:Uncharacterized protein n=1 Tax=Sphingomonas mucosissima TaxID=370959 RepID=A0A245ZJQ4_9SPHN|nr:hypothetical protein SPMU_23780 [Sphingomonas mucosissima]
MQLMGRMHGAGTYLYKTDIFNMTRTALDPLRVKPGDAR